MTHDGCSDDALRTEEFPPGLPIFTSCLGYFLGLVRNVKVDKGAAKGKRSFGVIFGAGLFPSVVGLLGGRRVGEEMAADG